MIISVKLFIKRSIFSTLKRLINEVSPKVAANKQSLYNKTINQK